jgi:hypothetical protein
MICPNCGTQNAAGSNFCIACGADLTPTATDEHLRTDSVAPRTPQTPPHTSPSVDIPPEYINTAPPPPPPPPPAPPYTPPVYTPPPAYTTPAATYAPARKERSIAFILEIVGGIFGLPGIGWLYAGEVTPGAILLGVMLVVNLIGVFVAFFTFFVSCFCSVPLNLVVMAVSALMLRNHMQQHPETFGP